ncbi:TolC family protein [uncultured Kordia sp.]|uniref:TolC family protein n=1 Tax=uncultured Kordia sp. TaxID=507699 RepID=UPI002630B0D8|nr:TolC family protein [uncultured Kordia sp.]
MNKQLLLFIFLLLSITSFAQKTNYNIGILLDKRTEKIDTILVELQKQIKAVVGEDAVINFSDASMLVNDFNIQKAEDNYKLLLTNDTDIILAFGGINNKIVNNQTNYVKPTILFGAVNKDFHNINFSKKTSGIENFTYLIESKSFLDDIKTFKELTDFKKLGIIIDRPLVDQFSLKESFDIALKKLDANYKLIPFDTITDITSSLTDVDAVYLGGGFYLSDADLTSLAQNLIQKKIPSFTNLGIDYVQNGFMATNESNENSKQLMRRIALSIEGFVNGKSLSEMPVFVEYNPRLTINYNTAEQVGVPIKYSLINDTDFVGEFKNVLSKKTYTILEVIDDALNKNLSLQAQKKDIDLSNQDVKLAKSNYLPSLTASGSGTYVDPNLAEVSLGQNPEFSTSGNITLQQTIFSEAANANITIQKKLQKAQQENFNASELDIVFNASNAYFNVLILKANVQIQLRNLNLTKSNLQIAQQNFDAGQSGKSDVLRFRSQMAQNTQSMVESINQLEQSYVALNQVINNPVKTEIDVEDVTLNNEVFKEYNYDLLVNLLDDPTSREPFIDFLVEEAKNNAPELKSLGYNLEAVERNLKLNSNGRFLPTVALQGQYNSTFNRSGAGSEPPQGFSLVDNSYNVGVNVSIPIFNQNKTNINRQTASIQKDQLNINKENIELAIASNIRTAVYNVANQISNIELSKVSEETAKEALELTQVSYANGAVNIIQLIDAQNNYLNAQQARTTAAYSFLINALQLERFLGSYFLLNTKEKNTQFTQRFLEYLSKRN